MNVSANSFSLSTTTFTAGLCAIMNVERYFSMRSSLILFIAIRLFVVATPVSSQSPLEVVLEKPCGRIYPTAASIEINRGPAACIDACLNQDKPLAAHYMDKYCFCADSYTAEYGLVNLTSSPQNNSCNNTGQFASVYSIGILPDIKLSIANFTPGETDLAELIDPSVSVELNGTAPADAVIELDQSDALSNVHFPPMQSYLNDSGLMLRTYDAVEVVAYLYNPGQLNRPDGFIFADENTAVDCELSKHCSRSTAMVWKRDIGLLADIDIHCEPVMIIEELYECDIVVYGQNFDLTVDFGDEEINSVHNNLGVAGSDPAVFGYADSDKYYSNSVFAYGQSQPNEQYLMFHRTITEPGVIHAWEYSMQQAGQFKFMVYRPVCSGTEIYCHKSKECVASKEICLESLPNNHISCISPQVFSLTKRVCVQLGEPSYSVVVPSLDYSFVAGTTIDNSAADSSSLNHSIIHHLSNEQYIKVLPGDVISARVISGAVSLVALPASQKSKIYTSASSDVPTVTAAAADSDYEPLVTAHLFKGFTYAIEHSFVAGCKSYRVEARASTDHSSINMSTTVQAIDRISHLTFYADFKYGNSSDGYPVAKANEAVLFSVPEHRAYCESDYFWNWNDSSAIDFITGISINHTFSVAGIYTISLTAATAGENVTVNLTVLVQEAISELSVNNVESVTLYGQAVTFDVSFTQGSEPVLSFITGDPNEASYTLTNLSPSTQLSHIYSVPDLYQMNITLNNYVSTSFVQIWMPVEETITGLQLTSGNMFFNDASSTRVNVSLDSGTRVNFTCVIDNSTECSDLDISWQTRAGVVRLNVVDYITPGNHYITVTAANLITPHLVSQSLMLDILHPLVVQNVTITTPGADPSLVHPNDPIYWTIHVVTGSRLEFSVLCSNGYAAQDYRATMESESITFAMNFTDDGVYYCNVSVANAVESYIEEQTFRVQYAVENIELKMIDADGNVGINQSTLEPPNYWQVLRFSLVRPENSPLPTNCSWSVQFDNETEQDLGTFIESSDETSYTVAGYQHTLSVTRNYSAGGDYTVTFRLWNDITAVQVYEQAYRLYEEISGLSIDSIEHILNDIARPPHASVYKPTPTDATVTFDYYELDSDLQMLASIERGSHTTWMWDYGTVVNVTIGDSSCSSVIFNYASFPPTTYTVQLTVSNDISSLAVSRSLTLQKRVESIGLSTPINSVVKNTSIKWDLNFGELGTDACYFVDFNDPQLDADKFAFGNTALCQQRVFSNDYQQSQVQDSPIDLATLLPDHRLETYFTWQSLGQHMVSFTGVNLVSEITVTYVLGVTNTFCAFPIIDFAQQCADYGACNGAIRDVHRSEPITVKANLHLQCDGRAVNYTWALYKYDVSSGSREKLNVTYQFESPSIISLPARSLQYGLHLLELNISMFNEVGIYSINSTLLNVIASPLVVGLEHWPLMTAKFKEDLNLNAVDGSYDPDAPEDIAGLQYTWLCRRECESYPTYDTTTWNVDTEMGTYCENYTNNDYGCFYGDGFNSSGLFATNDLGNISIPTNASYENQTLFFKVYVQKDSREASLEVQVMLQTGDPPQITILPEVNSKEKTNTDQKFSVKTKIAKAGPYDQYIYRWELYDSSGGIGWTLASNNSINMTRWREDLASTQQNSRSLAIKANSWLSSDFESIYIKVVAHRKGFADNSGFQVFPIVFNNPPISNKTACRMQPSNGTADSTLFGVDCSDGAFVDEDQPFTFELTILLPFDSKPVLLRGPASQISALNGFKLPFGQEVDEFAVTLYLNCYDSYGARSSIDLQAKVVPRNVGSDQLLEDTGNKINGEGLQLLMSGDTNEGYATFMMIATSLNDRSDIADSSESTNGTQADSENEKLREEKTKLKDEAIGVVVTYFPQNTIEDVQKCANVLKSLLSVEGEVSATSIAASNDKMQQGIDVIANDDSLSYSDKKKTLESYFGALGNMLSANKFVEERQAVQERRKRETDSSSTSELERTLALVDSAGGVLRTTLVPDEAPEEIATEKLKMSTSKNSINSFKGQMATSDGASVTLTDSQGSMGSPNASENAVLTTQLSSMKNPFFSSLTQNTTEANVLRMVVEGGEDGPIRLENNANRTNNIYIPTPDAVEPKPVTDMAGNGNISAVRKLQLAPNVSLSIKLSGFLRPNFNTTNSTELNSSLSTTSASSLATAVPGNLSFDFSNVSLRVYLRKEYAVNAGNYDYLCEIPVADVNKSSHSSFSSDASENATKLPPGITIDQLHKDTCFMSDRALNLQSYTDIYYAVEYFDSTQSASGSRQSVTAAWEPWYSVYYQMTAISSQCRFFDPVIDDWNTKGCEVGPLTTVDQTHCVCSTISVDQDLPDDLLTTTPWFTGSGKKYNPFGGISFGASFAAPFNTFDPNDPTLWSNLSENPLVFSVMVSVWCFYLCCLIWARRWDMKDEIKAGASPLLDNDPGDSYLYELTVFTGTARGAGTTAKVSMIFAGFEEETPPRLIYDDKRSVLQTGGVDSFLMTTPRSLGPLNHIRVWHDNSGRSPGWQFAYMCVIDLITKEKYFFVCNNWLSVAEGDGAIDRMIPTATRDDLIDFSHLFWTKARKDLTDSHIWFSVFGRPPKSVFTRVQRITCCLTLLFTSMCVGIALYQGDDKATSTGQSFKLGPLTLTFVEIQLGIYSSLLVFPMNLLIVYIFRNCKHRESPKLREAKKRARDYEKLHEKSLTNLRRSAVKQKKKTECLLPWWCQGVAYFLCLACCVVCFWATVSYGLSFGAEKSEKWLVSFVTSFVESLLLSQPIKVVLFAMFYALVIRSPTIEDELDNDPGLLQGEEYLHTHSKNYNVQHLQLQKTLVKYKVPPKPPQPEFIAAAKKKKMKEKEMQELLREILAYIVFLYLLYSISYGSKDPMTYRMYRNQQNSLEFGLHHQYGPMSEGPDYTFDKPLPMSLVGSLDSFWVWAKQTYIPAVYSEVDYGGSASPRGSMMDGVNFLVGTTRFRQVRVKEVNCLPVVYAYEQHCAEKISSRSVDKADYGTSWSKLSNGEEAAKGFIYENATTLEGSSSHGTFGYYEGGGYVHTLGKTQKVASKQLDYLQANNWIDELTRAIFVEFTTFNNQLNLYSVSYIVFEMANTGALYPKFDVKLIRLERYQNKFGAMVLISELVVIIYTVFFLVKEIKLLRKQRLAYFKDFWNVVECVTITLLLISTTMCCYRFYLLFKTSERKQSFKHNDYISYQYLAAFEESYLYLLAFLVFISTCKFLKLLRFNKKMNVLGHTLLYIAKPFVTFMLTMIMVFVAYSHMAFLVFNTLLGEFATLFTSMGTLFTLMLNKFDYKSMERANPVFAPFIFVTFTVSMGFMMVNFMLSIIIEGFTTVRMDLANQPNQYEIVDFVVGKFKAVMGMGSEEMPPMRDKKEDFVEDSQKELDMKFGEFSDRVFGMFLQDPDDMKTMKMAEDLISHEKRHRQKKKKIVLG